MDNFDVFRQPAEIAQLGERQTEDLKVPGSIRRTRRSSEHSRVSADFFFFLFLFFFCLHPLLTFFFPHPSFPATSIHPKSDGLKHEAKKRSCSSSSYPGPFRGRPKGPGNEVSRPGVFVLGCSAIDRQVFINICTLLVSNLITSSTTDFLACWLQKSSNQDREIRDT